jgi:hypothetical protein
MSVSEFIKKIKFYSSDDDNGDSEVPGLFRSMFQFHLFRWLWGKGHPTPLQGGHVPQDVFDKELNDPLVRARLLLNAVADTDLMPVDSGFELRVSCLVLPSTHLSDFYH